MAIREMRVIQGAVTACLDKDGKKVKRYRFGQVAKLDDRFVDVDRLVELKAIQPASDEAPARPINARAAGLAAKIANQGNPSPVVNLGEVKNEDAPEGDADPLGVDPGFGRGPSGEPGPQPAVTEGADQSGGGPVPGAGPGDDDL